MSNHTTFRQSKSQETLPSKLPVKEVDYVQSEQSKAGEPCADFFLKGTVARDYPSLAF
jgi:hypothetical protein